MKHTDLTPYTPYAEQLSENISIFLPTALTIAGGIILLAWKNHTAFLKLKSLAVWFGGGGAVMLIFGNLIFLGVAVPDLETIAFEEMGTPSNFAFQHIITRIQSVYLAVDNIISIAMLGAGVFCVFSLAQHLFEEHENSPKIDK